MRYSVFCVALLFAVQANAQSSAENPVDDIVEEQTGAELPDGVAFYQLVLGLSGVAASNREFAESILQENMGLTAARASSMLDELLGAKDALAREDLASTRQLFCNPSQHGLTRAEAFTLIETQSELKDLVAARFFLLFKNQLDSTEAARLQQFVAAEKRNMGRVKLDNQRVYERTGQDPLRTIADICSSQQ